MAASKKEYIAPQLEFLLVDNADIITSSSFTGIIDWETSELPLGELPLDDNVW
jgi:hypothetical protein